jgi:hypothetical protein
MDPRSQRGSALVMAVIVVLVITVLGVGIIRFAAREVAGSTAGARHQALVACAEAGRRLLAGQFHAVGVTPTALQALNVPLDGPANQATMYAIGGHINDDLAGAGNPVQVNQVVFLPDNAFGPSNRVRDLSNVISLAGQGGRPLKVVVHCQDHGDGTATSGRQLEVEFGVRFGL